MKSCAVVLIFLVVLILIHAGSTYKLTLICKNELKSRAPFPCKHSRVGRQLGLMRKEALLMSKLILSTLLFLETLLILLFATHLFRSSLPKIKDYGDLATFIAKYQNAFSENVILNISGEESSRVPCNRDGFIKFHLLLTFRSYKILMGFQALACIYKLWLGFNEFRASHIVKWMGNGCYYISLRNVVLIQHMPKAKVPIIDIVERGLHEIPVGIPSRSREYNPGYSLDGDISSQVPITRRIFGPDSRTTKVTVMSALKKLLLVQLCPQLSGFQVRFLL
ncbi:hypothetical protein F0562_002978 [Nyssa sinensis]|uniref:Uncharacterized protein n=1 Tax=Nyssa sinensis TaxID=561372 RepID=A0A5J5BT71_9ASTE|nr:hypothetical protein F0562_002978 [Nyssa sinensis]